MYCQKCGKQIADDAMFCQYCGSEVHSKIQYEKDTKKCPNCGGLIYALETKCKFCGYEIDADIPDSVKDFEKKLTEVLNAPKEKTKRKWYDAIEPDENAKKAIQLIRNYAIPNNTADILDFLILAVSNIVPSAFDEFNGTNVQKETDKHLSEAWISKYQQAVQKAKVLGMEQDKIDRAEQFYNEKMRQVKKEKAKVPIFLLAMFAGIILMFALMIIGFRHM
ncbi:zinc ribbon domain-containing protein [Butyrivibrio sp. CB08]|uniref:zinc ribbon domain-containing protein n=1 Tax=Butyrivibrio sp. CB08 TaxID=2364879 RepID=UPI000EA8A766|nr:zinc ribbon domain-containing protein [Butyrivibrio sp. CB08]RKM55406.1 zinc ribbon domain-containing protein [Butyrivibrio sp. CB08]